MRPYEASAGRTRLLTFIFIVFVGVVLAGAFLARRNLALGRGDRRGAFKLAAIGFAASALGDLSGSHLVPTFAGIVSLVYMTITRSLFVGLIAWLLYIALEPYVRRQTPHRLVAWTRLLSGKFRDSLVGRDLLVGALLGVVMNLSKWMGELASRQFGIPPDLTTVQLDTMLGIRGIGPVFVGLQPAASLVQGLGFVFLLLLLRVVLRGERRAAITMWALMVTAFALTGMHPLLLLFYGVLAAAFVFVMSRFGMLALTVGQFIFFTIEFFPYTSDFSVFYADAMLLSIAVVVSVAGFGFWTSLAGRPLLSASLLEE